MMPAPSHLPSSSSHGAPEGAELDSSPSAALVSTEGHVLPLAGASIRAEAGGGIARVVLEQRFRNVHDVPLHVTYTLPLPADGAVSGFSFRLGAQRIVGEIDRRHRPFGIEELRIVDDHVAAPAIDQRVEFRGAAGGEKSVPPAGAEADDADLAVGFRPRAQPRRGALGVADHLIVGNAAGRPHPGADVVGAAGSFAKIEMR